MLWRVRLSSVRIFAFCLFVFFKVLRKCFKAHGKSLKRHWNNKLEWLDYVSCVRVFREKSKKLFCSCFAFATEIKSSSWSDNRGKKINFFLTFKFILSSSSSGLEEMSQKTGNNILSPQGSACSAKGGVNEDSENDLAIGTYDESDLVWNE